VGGDLVFDDLATARQRARRYPTMGAYIAELRIPDGAPVLIRPSVGEHPWTLVGGAGVLFRCAARVVRV
jgi:hypothetical protein